MHTPLVAFGIWLASESGGVHDFDVPMFVPIVPEAEPNEYNSVCTVFSLCRAIEIVMLLPSSAVEGADGSDTASS